MDLPDINMEIYCSDQEFFLTFPMFSIAKDLALYTVQLKLTSNI